MALISEKLLELLACPADKGVLKEIVEKSCLECQTCGRRYPVRDGIPVMLLEEATPPVKDLPAQDKAPSAESAISEDGQSSTGAEQNVEKASAGSEPPQGPRKGSRRRKALPPKKKPPKIHNVTWSRENPVMLILQQHTAHRVRIAKIIALATAIFLVIFFAAFMYNKFKIREDLRMKVAGVEKALARIDESMKSCTGYSKYRKILDAIKWADYAAGFDRADRIRWEKIRQSYIDKLEGSKPEMGGDFIVPSAAVDMVFIPRGQFMMGRKQKEMGANSDELPRRKVTLSYDFWMSRAEISNSQFMELFPGHVPESWGSYFMDLPQQPVVRVDWHASLAYCAKVTEYEQGGNRIPEGYEYRLPTEAEWEYACRAGTDTYYYWGDSFGQTGARFANSLDIKAARKFRWKEGDDMATDDGNLVSAPCSHYKANAFGLYDMSGNVWEWCYDWYNPDAYSTLPDTNPVQLKPVVARIEIKIEFDRRYDADCTSKVLRGGSWGNLPIDCRSAARSSTVPEDKRNTGIGFRIVLGPKISTGQPADTPKPASSESGEPKPAQQ